MAGLTGTDQLVNSRLMNNPDGTSQVAQGVERAWYERVGWTTTRQAHLEYNQAPSGTITPGTRVDSVIPSGSTDAYLYALWRETRPPATNVGPPILPPAPPSTPPGQRPWEQPGYSPPVNIPNLGAIWGGTSGNLLPVNANYRGVGGGTCRNPRTYRASDWEKIMLARVIAGEARNMPLAHQVAVGEVVMRRVMCKNWGGNTIYDIISAPGQYDTFSRDTWQVVQTRRRPTQYVWATQNSTNAANSALMGTSNYSQGMFFQHSDATKWSSGGERIWLDGMIFSNSSASRNWRCGCNRKIGLQPA